MKKYVIIAMMLIAACMAATAQEAVAETAVAETAVADDLFAGIDALALSGEEMAAVEGGRTAYDAFDTALSAPRTTKPIPGAVPSSETGPRKPIVTAGGTTRNSHEGTDYPARAGTAVRSAKDGKVLSVGSSATLGGEITIANTDGSRSRYVHVVGRVSEGERVRSGDTIATVGVHGKERSGGTMSTGDHLHYEEHDYSGKRVETSFVEHY